jgi:hypothetical protein
VCVCVEKEKLWAGVTRLLSIMALYGSAAATETPSESAAKPLLAIQSPSIVKCLSLEKWSPPPKAGHTGQVGQSHTPHELILPRVKATSPRPLDVVANNAGA